MTMIGIMQGRLSPPENGHFQCFPLESWREEFTRAKQAGLACIEWIDDTYSSDHNPLRTAQGVQEIRALVEQTGVQVLSICADTFMEQPLVRCSDTERLERIELLRLLLRQTASLGARHIMLPFVDNSSLKTDEEVTSVVSSLRAVLPEAAVLGVGIHLETDLPPERQRALLDQLPEEHLQVTYDIGNSAANGFTPVAEFAAYGERIGSLHVKDRIRGGGTVPLGNGDADIPTVFSLLQQRGYNGIFILQVARDVAGNEVAWAQQNIAFVQSLLHGSATE